MIMRIVRETEVYLCEFRDQLASDLEEYETGRRTSGLLRNGLHHDDSQNRIAELRRRLARADNLIATYQKYKDA